MFSFGFSIGGCPKSLVGALCHLSNISNNSIQPIDKIYTPQAGFEHGTFSVPLHEFEVAH